MELKIKGKKTKLVYSLYYSIMTRKGWHHIYMVGSLLHTFKKGDSISKKHTASQLPGYGQCLTLAYISQRLIRRFCCGVRALCSTAAAQSRYELLVVKCSKGTQRMDLL